MKIKTLIETTRELTHTPLSDAVLLMFLSNCENTILTDVLLAAPENCEEYTAVTTDALLVPHPFDKLYLPYMQAQIYHAEGEFAQYQNYMDLYNEYRDEYARYILSNVSPAKGQAAGNGYYITAYAIAVAHGFSGTEEEWLAGLNGKDGKSAFELAMDAGYTGTEEDYRAAAAQIAQALRYTAQELTKAQKAQARENIAAVPTSRKVAGKALTGNVTLTATDIQYQGAIDGERVIDADSALDLLAARKAVFLVTLTRAADGTFTANKTLAQITEAYNNGAALQCVYTNDKKQWDTARLPLAYIRSDLACFSAFLTPAQGETQLVAVNCASGSGGDVWNDYSTRLTGADVDYAGKVGSNTASTVSEALDALATGAPLDMSADYAASGAASVAAWATMAKTGDATKYRVTAGRYQINSPAGSAYNVVITSVPDDSARIVQITECNNDPFMYFSVYSVSSPGEAPVNQVYFSTEEGLFDVFGRNVILPSYGAEDKGKVLTVDDSGNPKWKAAAALPTVGAADNGKFLRVVSGAWAAEALTNVAEVGA